METFTGCKPFVENSGFQAQRCDRVNKLKMDTIDGPIVDLVKGLSKLHFCFTLQSCWGHFLYKTMRDRRNTERLVSSATMDTVEYRLAYLALCIEDSAAGRELYRELKKTPEIDPPYIQFGCADWFWERQVNSYVLQVEPERHRTKDRVTVGYEEALRIQDVRDRFFFHLNGLLRTLIEE